MKLRTTLTIGTLLLGAVASEGCATTQALDMAKVREDCAAATKAEGGSDAEQFKRYGICVESARRGTRATLAASQPTVTPPEPAIAPKVAPEPEPVAPRTTPLLSVAVEVTPEGVTDYREFEVYEKKYRLLLAIKGSPSGRQARGLNRARAHAADLNKQAEGGEWQLVGLDDIAALGEICKKVGDDFYGCEEEGAVWTDEVNESAHYPFPNAEYMYVLAPRKGGLLNASSKTVAGVALKWHTDTNPKPQPELNPSQEVEPQEDPIDAIYISPKKTQAIMQAVKTNVRDRPFDLNLDFRNIRLIDGPYAFDKIAFDPNVPDQKWIGDLYDEMLEGAGDWVVGNLEESKCRIAIKVKIPIKNSKKVYESWFFLDENMGVIYDNRKKR